MSKTEKIVSKLESHYSILEFLRENHPQILEQWKNKESAVVTSHSSKTLPVPEPVDIGGDPKSQQY